MTKLDNETSSFIALWALKGKDHALWQIEYHSKKVQDAKDELYKFEKIIRQLT